MNEKNLQEIEYRRKAFKFFDKGKSTKQILKQIPRSRSWLFKFKRRFFQEGFKALDSLSKRPKSFPVECPSSVREVVLKVQQRLAKQDVGFCGPRAVWLELKRRKPIKDIPSVSTIKRILRAAGFTKTKEERTKLYYPHPCFERDELYLASDWVARYIRGGEKVFCFNTIDVNTFNLSQTIASEKSADVACSHLLQSAQELGIASYLQVDNDAAFTGLGKRARIFGRFVRCALYLGIELIFLPPGEPKRNGLVERVNGLWTSGFWDKNVFESIKEVRNKAWKFQSWYSDYEPPSLKGKSVREASQEYHHKKLSLDQVERIPAQLPLTQGRIHYIRKVNAQGRIEILKESWMVSKSLRGSYVWATIDLSKKKLEFFYRKSERASARKVKEYAFRIEEKIEKLLPEYKKKRRRKSVLQII